MARAFHILLVLLKKMFFERLLVYSACMIKNKMIPGLLVYLVVLVGASIQGVPFALISTRPVYSLKGQ